MEEQSIFDHAAGKQEPQGEVQGLPKDWKSQLEKMRAELSALDGFKESLGEKYKMSVEQLEDYVKNPSNFSEAEWKVLEEVRAKAYRFKEEVEDLREFEKNPSVAEAKEAKKAAEKKKKPKAKKGARRGWLSMD